MLNWKLLFFLRGGETTWVNDSRSIFYESTTTNTPILGRFLRLRTPSESEPQSFTSEIHFRCTLSSTERNRSLAEITPSPGFKPLMVWARPVRITVYRPSVHFWDCRYPATDLSVEFDVGLNGWYNLYKCTDL